MDPVERKQLLKDKAVALHAQYPHATLWKAETLAAIARASARQEVLSRVPVMDFKSFVARDPVTPGAALMPRVVDTTAENAGHDRILEGVPLFRSVDPATAGLDRRHIAKSQETFTSSADAPRRI